MRVLLTLLLVALKLRGTESFAGRYPTPSPIETHSLNKNEECQSPRRSPRERIESSSRRSLLRDSSGIFFVLSQWVSIFGTANPALALASEATSVSVDRPMPRITQKVVMEVRISRPDGTFYIRGDETDEQVKKYTLQFGLFGKAAPTHVERFISYIIPSEDVLRDDRPMPSYGQSQFKSFDQATGMLFGGFIPSLEVTEFAGSTALKYGGRILPAPLWLEKKSADGATTDEALPLPHSTKGLLIHRKLDVSPTFGITTRSDSGSYVSDFDREFVAFGVVLEGMDFLKYCQELPTYSVERPAQDDNLAQDAAKAVFDAQNHFFRGAAKSFGDTRISKVFPGKLLRRVEVTRVSVL